MTKKLSTVLAASSIGVLAGVVALETDAQAQIIIAPPAPVIATMTPVYYGGRASYYYGGRWMYRNGNAWSYYQNVPPYLAQRRMGYAPVYRHYYGGGYRGGWHGRRW